jgi:hypothetical protein
VRVSFLDADGVADVLQVEDDAFPLSYSPEALARIHRLTGGQLFLVQLVGDGLVQGFNRRLREEIHPPSSTLAEGDVEALVASGALYEQGTVYFRGIWDQAGTGAAGQHVLLRALAPHPNGLDEAGLGREAGLSGTGLSAALQALLDQDVLSAEGGRYRFSVELMRLVGRGGADGGTVGSSMRTDAWTGARGESIRRADPTQSSNRSATRMRRPGSRSSMVRTSAGPSFSTRVGER